MSYYVQTFRMVLLSICVSVRMSHILQAPKSASALLLRYEQSPKFHMMTKFWHSCRPSSNTPATLCLPFVLLLDGPPQEPSEPSALGTGWLPTREGGG